MIDLTRRHIATSAFGASEEKLLILKVIERLMTRGGTPCDITSVAAQFNYSYTPQKPLITSKLAKFIRFRCNVLQYSRDNACSTGNTSYYYVRPIRMLI